mmetsp:Transcript_32559/g.49082  ORF Transcript_32559/g.49082 Transcript_32559/m.49082 type:complete len:329 (-) Transcript_32559:188-1174(-)|eukprot:CAMPEP_0178902424 /NCGR_PEP_ID=MMETSP0786-20121207/4593_1 /TAXON_ID=186022 /ORGANISM="Thalassionema frauenfeldii, Strain CCMP 1798" /LENGTH=328 /DNA_ID=CAMNT_0020573681 /DNA_START=168 /DNA_END=1154 /DNA_ORIENTATION=+
MSTTKAICIPKSETTKLDEEETTVLEEDDYSSGSSEVESNDVDVIKVECRRHMSRGMSTSALFGKQPLKSTESKEPTVKRGISRAASASHLFSTKARNNDGSPMSHLRRLQREENAELWELLRQSKARIEQQNNASLSLKKEDATKREEIEQSFEQENLELFDLLQQSKRRLVDAVSKAEEKAAKDKELANPYMDLRILPEIGEDEEISETDLTTKELLTAMAVAEEAARFGKDSFETPTKDVLRSRDYSSFAFLKEDKENESLDDDQPDELLLIQEERNNCRAIYNLLSKRWDDFEKRATLRMFTLVRQTSKLLLNGFSARKKIEVE